jgi:hypothetical protein
MDDGYGQFCPVRAVPRAPCELPAATSVDEIAALLPWHMSAAPTGEA